MLTRRLLIFDAVFGRSPRLPGISPTGDPSVTVTGVLLKLGVPQLEHIYAVIERAPDAIASRMTSEGSLRGLWFREPWLSDNAYAALYAVGLAAAAAAGYQLARLYTDLYHPDFKQYLLSKIAYWCADSNRAAMTRSSFNQAPDVHPIRPDNHTHPDAAARRSAANAFMTLYASTVGLRPYYVQMSTPDSRHGKTGSRSWFWSKDVTVPPSYTPHDPNDLLCIVDTDYYLKLPEYLLRHNLPALLYTFQPAHVASSGEDYAYTFDDNNHVEYKVTGGATYNHRVWNFGRDAFTVCATFFGIPWKLSTYLIDRRPCGTDHELILLTPTATWRLLGAIFASWVVEASPLAYLKLFSNGFNRLELFSNGAHTISTGKPHQSISATVPADTDATIANIARNLKHTMTIPSVEGCLPPPKTEDEIRRVKAHAVILCEFHNSNTGELPDVLFPLDARVRNYQIGKYEPSAKPTQVGYMDPFLDDCFAPDKTKDNEAYAVRERILKVRNSHTITPFLSLCIDEFAKHLFPVAGALRPTDVDEVFERQDRPSQRHLLKMAETILPSRICKSFIKSEAYSKVAAPRVISTINPVHKSIYSRYTYAFADVLKKEDWYCFGHPPAEIATRVSSLASRAKTVLKTDFSKFDGHIGPIQRALELACLMRAFPVAYHAELYELHGAMHHLRARCSLGTKYTTEDERLSGTPDTSIFNSIINAFTTYVSYRKMGFSHTVAWHFTTGCCFAGDDGLAADMDESIYVKTCESMGLEVKAASVERGTFGIEFLARIYGPNVWYGDPNSCADIRRQLAKFHATQNLPSGVTPASKLRDKATGLALMDSNTPVLGALAHKALSLIPSDTKSAGTESFWTRFDAAQQYPNCDSGWMEHYARTALTNFDYERFQHWIANVNNLDDYLHHPIFSTPTPAKRLPDVKFVVDGVTHYPLDLKSNPSPSPKIATPVPTTVAKPTLPTARTAVRRPRPKPATVSGKARPTLALVKKQ